MGFGDAHPPSWPRRGAGGGRGAATSPSDRPLPGDGAATRWRTTERGKAQVRGAAGARPSPPAATPGRAEELRPGWVSLPLGPRPQRDADSAAACRAPGRGGEAPSPAPAGFPAPPLRPPAPLRLAPPPRPSLASCAGWGRGSSGGGRAIMASLFTVSGTPPPGPRRGSRGRRRHAGNRSGRGPLGRPG